jgi:hypothetical protein
VSDGLIPSRDAAALWGCHARGFTQRMAKWGVQPVVRPATTRQGGKSHWWRPADVMRARSLAAKEAAQDAAARPPEPTDEATRQKRDRLAILRRHYAQERWRKYWAAKDAARQQAKQAARKAAQEAR